MSERSERTSSGTAQQANAGGDRRAADETTSVFVADAASDQSEHDTTHLERPGAPTPPWQRVHAASGSSGSSGSSGDGSHAAHDGGGPAHAADHGYRSGPGMPDQQTVAEPRPSYAPPNGSPVQNPFLVGSSGQPHHHGDPQGPPPVHPGQPIPLGGPGAIPVGGHSAPAGGQQRQPMTSARPTARPAAGMRARGVRAPRKASLQIRRFDPWSVLKLSLVLSVAMFLMWLVAVGVLYGVLDGMGVWDKLNGAYSDLASVNDETGGGEPLISAGRVFGVSAVVGLVNIVLFTAFATVSAFVYNVSADLAGGIEVTLSERD